MDEFLTADRVRPLCFPGENGDSWGGRLELQFRLAPGFTLLRYTSATVAYNRRRCQLELTFADITFLY
jgi:hypothetical protein